MEDAEEWSFQENVLGDEQCHQPNHRSSSVPPLGLCIEGTILSAIWWLFVEHGDQSSSDNDGGDEREPDQSFPNSNLLPHALAGDNFRNKRPRNTQHCQSAVDSLRCRSIELHQARGVGVPVLGTTFTLWTIELLDRWSLENAEWVVFCLWLNLGVRLQQTWSTFESTKTAGQRWYNIEKQQVRNAHMPWQTLKAHWSIDPTTVTRSDSDSLISIGRNTAAWFQHATSLKSLIVTPHFEQLKTLPKCHGYAKDMPNQYGDTMRWKAAYKRSISVFAREHHQTPSLLLRQRIPEPERPKKPSVDALHLQGRSGRHSSDALQATPAQHGGGRHF